MKIPFREQLLRLCNTNLCSFGRRTGMGSLGNSRTEGVDGVDFITLL